jgi:hypothetical protein
MAYLANAMSASIDADKIAVYCAEFKRRGIREEAIKPIFLAACDAGFLFFPSVDALVALRPRRHAPLPRLPSAKQEAEFKRGFQEFLENAKKHGIEIKSMPKPRTREELEH